MGATGLSADPKEYRTRLADQSDDQIDAWAAELMRDVAIRRGVVKVVERLPTRDAPRRAWFRTGVRFRRRPAGASSAATGRGHLMVPDDHPPRPRPGHPLPGPGRPGPAHRVPRRELRGDRLRLRRRALAGRLGRPSGWSGSPTRSPRVLDGLVTAARRRHRRPATRPTAVRLGLSMIALQVSIGILNDLVDAPRDAGRKPAQADPGRPRRPGSRRAMASWPPRHRPRPRGPVRRADGRAWRSSSSASATATTGSPRARPGRGCRSRSGSRSCPVYGWLGAAGELPAVLRGPRRRSRCSPAPRSRSPTPWPTSSATPAAGVASVARRLGRSGRGWLHARACSAVVVVAAPRDARRGRGRQPPALVGAGGRRRGRSSCGGGLGPGRRPGASPAGLGARGGRARRAGRRLGRPGSSARPLAPWPADARSTAARRSGPSRSRSRA